MNMKQYKEIIEELRIFLDEDDNVYQVAKDVVESNEELERFIREELGENTPWKRLAKDIF